MEGERSSDGFCKLTVKEKITTMRAREIRDRTGLSHVIFSLMSRKLSATK